MEKPSTTKPEFPRVEESVAPGTVDLSGWIISVESIDDRLYYRVQVQEIHGYGMSARPVTEGTEIVVSIEKAHIDSDSLLSKKLSHSDQLLRMTVKSERGNMDQQRNAVWQLRTIK